MHRYRFSNMYKLLKGDKISECVSELLEEWDKEDSLSSGRKFK